MIIKDATVTVDFGTGAEALTDHVIMIALEDGLETTDDRTLGAPNASDSVSGVQSMVLTCKYSDTLIGLLTGHEGDTWHDMVITPTSGATTITCQVKFAALPFPSNVQSGEKVECELPLAVDQLAYT